MLAKRADEVKAININEVELNGPYQLELGIAFPGSFRYLNAEREGPRTAQLMNATRDLEGVDEFGKIAWSNPIFLHGGKS